MQADRNGYPPAVLQLVATCGLGLEELLAEELRGLVRSRLFLERGAVRFEGSWEDCWRANLRLRTANRVLVELASWAAPSDEALARGIESFLLGRKVRRGKVGEVDLVDLFAPSRSIAITASCSASTVTDSRWAALKIKDGICDAQRALFGERSEVHRESPDLPLRLRLHRERATLLLDSSGDPLDRRGYRRVSTDAPARETLAAACALAADRWDGHGPIVDPMCGSGTLLVEAAWIAKGRAPGWLRKSYSFERFPSFNAESWRAIRREFPPSPDPDVLIVGADIDAHAVRAANVNLEVAKLEDQSRVKRGRLSDWTPPPGVGLLLMNPPYGERISASDQLWRDMEELLRGRCAAWPAVILGGPEGRWRRMRMDPYRVLRVRNGPLDAEIVVFAPRRRL